MTGGFQGGIVVRQIGRDGKRDIAFTYADDQDARQGDHYSVRSRQNNDTVAQSSPTGPAGARFGHSQ